MFSTLTLTVVHVFSTLTLVTIHVFSTLTLTSIHVFSTLTPIAIHVFSTLILTAVHVFSNLTPTTVHEGRVAVGPVFQKGAGAQGLGLILLLGRGQEVGTRRSDCSVRFVRSPVLLSARVQRAFNTKSQFVPRTQSRRTASSGSSCCSLPLLWQQILSLNLELPSLLLSEQSACPSGLPVSAHPHTTPHPMPRIQACAPCWDLNSHLHVCTASALNC